MTSEIGTAGWSIPRADVSAYDLGAYVTDVTNKATAALRAGSSGQRYPSARGVQRSEPLLIIESREQRVEKPLSVVEGRLPQSGEGFAEIKKAVAGCQVQDTGGPCRGQSLCAGGGYARAGGCQIVCVSAVLGPIHERKGIQDDEDDEAGGIQA